MTNIFIKDMKKKQKKNKTLLAVFYDSSYKEINRIKYTKIQIFWLVTLVIIVLFVINFFIVANSPLKFFIPNYPTQEMINTMKINAILLDSIQNELITKNQYINNIYKIMNNDSLDNYSTEIIEDSNPDFPHLENVISSEDSMLRQEVEERDMFSLQMEIKNNAQNSLYQMNFFPPLKGIITNTFNTTEGHFGVDIVSKPNQIILSVLEGTVVSAYWSVSTGYSLQIQHPNNLISIFKHLSDIVVKEGSQIKAGQSIANVGNTGELSTGPHLHFELWYNGQPINPEEYISFK